jgi:hypothetical protein
MKCYYRGGIKGLLHSFELCAVSQEPVKPLLLDHEATLGERVLEELCDFIVQVEVLQADPQRNFGLICPLFPMHLLRDCASHFNIICLF